MSNSFLFPEMETAGRMVRNNHISELLSLGVAGATLAALGHIFWPFGITRAEVHADGTYVPGEGRALIVQPVFSDGELIDLVAWHPCEPKKWWRRTGLAWAIGEDNLTYRSSWDTEVAFPVVATPLDWLRAGAHGLVVLEWDAPEMRQLALLQVIEVESARFGNRLLDRITRPIRTPRIMVRRESHHVA